ncbi:hypothetical protein N9166_01905, partial [bacterium]|nr:hypothetical protein [bacterium]
MSSTERPAPAASAGVEWAWSGAVGPRLLLAVGLALLVGLVVHFGPARLLDIAHRLGPWLAVLLVFPMVAIQASFLLGWWFCFRDPGGRPPSAGLLVAHWV